MSVVIATIPVTEKLVVSNPKINTNFENLAVAVDAVQVQADDLQVQINSLPGGTVDLFSTLSPVALKMAVPFVQHACPAVGSSVTLATFTGVGIVDQIWITLGSNSDGSMGYDGRLQVFVDGAALPDIDCDLGTLFLTHLDGRAGAERAGSTAHISSSSMGDSGSGMSGGLKFPIPYSNGIIIKLYAPPGSTSNPTTDYTLFTQIVNKPGLVSNLRLRSNAVSWLNKKTYSASDIITFFNLTNAAGWLVWQSVAVKGAATSGNTYDYLERIWFWGVDGEPTTPDGNGVVTTAFSSSGGEDLFLYGWYFANAAAISGTPWTLVTATNNSNKTTVAGFDFWAAYGGLKFSTALKPGWSLKPSNVINNGHDMSWCFLYYIDTAVPFAPSAPSISATPGDSQVVLTITPPVSFGSAPITGYTGTISPGGGTFSLAASATTYTATGLTNNTAYTFSLTATNTVGVSAAGTVVSTPVAVAVPTIPAITSGTILGQYMANSLSASDGDRIASWPKNTGSLNLTFQQAAGGQQPLYKANIINGLPVLRFDAARSDQMTPNGSFNTAQPCFVLAVLNPTATSSNQIMDSYPGSSGHGRMACGINSSGFWNVYGGSQDAVGAAATTGVHVVAFVLNGASSYVTVDGVKGSNADIGANGIDVPTLGYITALAGDLAELIIGTGNISNGDRRLIEAYLGSKYNKAVV